MIVVPERTVDQGSSLIAPHDHRHGSKYRPVSVFFFVSPAVARYADSHDILHYAVRCLDFADESLHPERVTYVLLGNHGRGIAEDAPAVLRKHQRLACALEGMGRIVRVEYAGDSLSSQSCHCVEYYELVLEVEIGLRFVEDQYLRFCSHGPRYEHHLQFAAAYGVARLVREMRYA